MSEIGFGIIGCGNISTIHAKAIQAIPDARLKADMEKVRADLKALTGK